MTNEVFLMAMIQSLASVLVDKGVLLPEELDAKLKEILNAQNAPKIVTPDDTKTKTIIMP